MCCALYAASGVAWRRLQAPPLPFDLQMVVYELCVGAVVYSGECVCVCIKTKEKHELLGVSPNQVLAT